MAGPIVFTKNSTPGAVPLVGNFTETGEVLANTADNIFYILNESNTVSAYPALEADGTFDPTYLPDIAITSVSEVADQAAMLLLDAQVGDVAIRLDLESAGSPATYIMSGTDATNILHWRVLPVATDLVLTVAGRTGTIVLTKADITDFVEGDYATGAEGDLATTAVQPSDNVSTLTNDAGFLASADFVDGTATTATTGSVTDYDTVTLSSMTNTDYDGEYTRVNWGSVSGSTFTSDADQAIYSQAVGDGDFRVIYSNDSSGFFVNVFTTDPATWTNGAVTTNGTSESLTGYMATINGKYYPDSADPKVTYATNPTVAYDAVTGTIATGAANTLVTADDAKTVTDAIATTANNALPAASVLDEDTMTTDSATLPPSQQSVKVYVTAEIAASGGVGSFPMIDTHSDVEVDITNTGSFLVVAGYQTVDGSLVGLIGQTDSTENGLYDINASGEFTRNAEADADTDFKTGRSAYTRFGDEAGVTIEYIGANNPVVGTDAITFLDTSDTSLTDNSVAQANLQDDAVGTAEIIDANVTEAKLDSAVVTKLNLGNTSVQPNDTVGGGTWSL